MSLIKNLSLIIILFNINIYSQSVLSIKLTNGEYQTKNIEIELVNTTNKKCKISIDKSDFQPYTLNSLTTIRPLIEVKHKGQEVNFSNRFVELNENEIKILNEGKKLSVYKEKYDTFEIKPMKTFKIVIPFNPFSFNVKKHTYNSYQISFNEDYELKVYLKMKKNTCFDKIIESNTVITQWK